MSDWQVIFTGINWLNNHLSKQKTFDCKEFNSNKKKIHQKKDTFVCDLINYINFN